jgi:hypothetical protein
VQDLHRLRLVLVLALLLLAVWTMIPDGPWWMRTA